MNTLRKKSKWLIPIFLIVMGLFYLKNQESTTPKTFPTPQPEYGYEYEETEEDIAFEKAMDEADQAYPEIELKDLSDNELKVYKQKMQKLKASGFNFSAVLKNQYNTKNLSFSQGSPMSYANGAVTGTWSTKLPIPNPKPGKISKGDRVNGSIYDAINDKIYAVSNPGHLYRVSKTGQLQWTLLDHKRNYNKIFFGFNLPNGTFRMFKNEQPEALIGHLSYSDDEGKNWTPANGALLQNNWADNGLEAEINGNTRLFALGDHKNSSNTRTKYVFMSQDLGLNFTESSLNFKSADHQIQLLKTYNNNGVYLFVRVKATNAVKLYKYNDSISDFQLLRTLPITLTDFKRVIGTFSGGQVHFYISETGKIAHYSNDEGASWTNITTNRALLAIHPNQPGTIFKGFLDVNMSTDFGATYTNFSHELGWDLRHMTFHRKSNGTYFAFIGMDFGCFISDTAQIPTSYVPLNSGAPIGLMYDAASNEQFNTVHSAHQDKGASGFLDTGQVVNRQGLAGTDILRITYAKGGESIWIWYYTGKIEHRFNFAGPNYIDEKAPVASGFGNWTSRNIIASPDPAEDVIYGAWGTALQKFTYANGVATKSTHSYDFGKELSGFGYAPSNTNRWYVSAADGQFFYSNDGGSSFTATTYTGNTPASGGGYRKGRHIIRVSKTNPDLVFYAGNSKLFLISQDGGVTFTNHITGFDGDRIRDFAIADGDKYIFAACASEGPWVYSIDDDMWYKMDGADTPRVDFTDAEYISSKNIARFATFGTGVQDFILDSLPGGTGGPGGGSTTYYYVENKSNGVKMRPETTLDGSKLIRTASTATDNWVQWEKIDTDNGYFHLKNRETGKYFKPLSTDNNVLMEQVPDTQTDNWTQWELVNTADGDGYVHIINRETGKKIKRVSGTNIQQASTSSTGIWTRWKLVNAGAAKAEATSTLNQSLIKLHPNPINNNYLVIQGVPKNTVLNIFDSNGRKIISTLYNSKNIDISNLKSGVYLLKIDGYWAKRFVKN